LKNPGRTESSATWLWWEHPISLGKNLMGYMSHENVKGKAIPLQALTGLEGSRRFRLPDFKTVGTWRWQGCQPYALTAFTPRKYLWYSFMLEAESTPGP
jgi:hypothetical protein